MRNLFSRDFGEAPASPSAPTFTPEDVNRLTGEARRSGYEEGYAAGRRDGATEASETGAEALSRSVAGLAPDLALILEGFGAYRERVESELAAFMVTVADRLAPDLAEAYGPDRIAEEALRISRMALGSEWLEIGASARNLVVVKEALLPILPEARKKGLRFVEDQSLGPTGLRAAWAGGHAEYSYDRLSRAVTDVIRNSITRKTIPEGGRDE